jgi:hypothetical protein
MTLEQLDRLYITDHRGSVRIEFSLKDGTKHIYGRFSGTLVSDDPLRPELDIEGEFNVILPF